VAIKARVRLRKESIFEVKTTESEASDLQSKFLKDFGKSMKKSEIKEDEIKEPLKTAPPKIKAKAKNIKAKFEQKVLVNITAEEIIMEK